MKVWSIFNLDVAALQYVEDASGMHVNGSLARPPPSSSPASLRKTDFTQWKLEF